MIETINTGFEYLFKGLDLIRNILIKISSFLPWAEEISVMVVFLVLSLYLSYLLIKKFVTNPISLPYILYYFIIVLMMFTILNYV